MMGSFVDLHITTEEHTDMFITETDYISPNVTEMYYLTKSFVL
jgi:hypothetical protein